MCQIGGILNIKNNEKANQELIADTARFMLTQMATGNVDGSGIGVSYKNGTEYLTFKTKDSGAKLGKNLTIDTDNPMRHIILHTRFATQGAKNALNAHPHRGPHGIMVHNGWCPTLFLDIVSGLHHKQKSVDRKLEYLNLAALKSECDSEALAMVFNEDPEKFDSYLTGDEVFALLHMANDGKKVVLMTQYNTVNMAYSHKLGAVLIATKEFVLENTLKWLGEGWPVAEVERDSVFTFDGEGMTYASYVFGTNDRAAQEAKVIGKTVNSSRKTVWDKAIKRNKKAVPRYVTGPVKKKAMTPLEAKYGGGEESIGGTDGIKEYGYNMDSDTYELLNDDDPSDGKSWRTQESYRGKDAECRTFLDTEMGLVQQNIIAELDKKKE